MRLYLECSADETLAVALGVFKRDIIHSHGKGRISNYLKKKTGVMAMVDDDLGNSDTPTFGQFTEIASDHDIRLKINKASNNRLIVICPRLEPWIIKTAKSAGVKLQKHGLPELLCDFDADINHRLPNLSRLLAELLQLKNARLLWLQSLLAGKS